VELRFGNRRPDNLLQFEVYPSVIYDSLFTTYGADTLSEIRRWEVPLCTGPYRVVKFDTANGNLLVEANPHFAGKKPYIKEIFLYQSPTSTLDLALKDSLDMVFFLSPESYTKLQGTDKYAFRQFQSDQMLTLYPDLSVPIFQDINVRRAIACAIDRDAIRNIFSSSGSYSCGNMRPSFHPEYLADSSFQWSYNPGLARKYLSEAKTKERKIKLIGFFRDTTKTESKALLRMADMLQDVGFVVEVVKETKSSNISKMRYATNHGGLLVSNNTYPKSVSSFLNVPYLQEDYRLDSALWPIPPLMKELAYTFNSSMYQERKVVTSQELQKLHHQVIPSVPICVGTIVDARLNTIEGPDPYMGCLNFWNVEYWYFTDPAAKPKAPAQLPEQP
jgi:ABC-type transport system substrate-binding protein